ncbi:alkaline phosphatase family protein [Aetokthonos hydrillicola Thurmond2011]|jgi:acid phosphatase|uniref:Alkaline phosphatase family protein n=1 Tax=Aetokthonos hydrillicola Thurmond2011 TaxID=2712845 RepID=A0AAP5IG63_9CYAN|nr:alkaline phosphatase family protein [Aetokthonos hydrillicola]MBO3461294.1 acid phosphatase [Aetokthonos hydrillicola CCALA 1050]MBW4589632.1 alkaline phosphatase family protein [Aetokthonos hydrillicola CCALA 1050]MDR9899128.1 alkaline phosphatase family protein [Aetokthonos hydrillicola Thurmond2011]
MLRSRQWAGAITNGLAVLASVAMSAQAALAAVVPSFDHIVIVIEENHGYSQIIGSSSAPYINSLASQGALFTNSHGVTHPSQPNYLALFSGSTQGVTNDNCPLTFSGDNLAHQLVGSTHTFIGYSESMPSVGYTGCSSNSLYYRKHNPWVDFSNVASNLNQPFTSFPTNFSSLPTVAIVVPNQQNDMHDGTIQIADTWLKNNINAYAQWAKTNNSLLIVTWDEDNGTTSNRIPTIFVGAHVKTGQYSESINHYNVLRTIEDSYGLAGLGNAATAASIIDCWQ